MMINEEIDDEEIDLLALFESIKKHIVLVILSTVVCAAAAGCISVFLITPQYESNASMYMLTKETVLTSLADLQIGSQLTNDYQVIVKSRPVLNDVIDKLNLDMDYVQLEEKLEITNPSNTRILNLSVTDVDPVRAKDIVNCIAETASEYIADTMEMVPPKIIESGEINNKKVSPSNTKNVLIGAAIGIVISCGIIVLQFLLNDTIVTTDDVEKYLGVSVLASVPLREDYAKEKDDKKEANKKQRRRGRR